MGILSFYLLTAVNTSVLKTNDNYSTYTQLLLINMHFGTNIQNNVKNDKIKFEY